MIDLHCHILPGLDDGAIDLSDSVAMARQAQSDGIDVVCGTPHIHPDHQVQIDELVRRVSALNEELVRQSVSVRVVPGGEVAETIAGSIQDEQLTRVSLGGEGGWILIEPKPGPLGTSLELTVRDLSARGFRSVIAHPERHPSDGFRGRLEALVEAGALVQVTAALVASGPAAATMLDLAGVGLVHLLGSDAHSSHGGRPLQLSQGLARLAEVELIAPHLDWIAEQGPAAILRGEAVEPPFAPI